MRDIQAVYDSLARGVYIPIGTSAVGSGLLDMAREHLKGDAAGWEGAFLVALRVGNWMAATLFEEAVVEGPPEQKHLALTWAEKAGENGLKGIRAALSMEDASLVTRAFDILTRHGEPSATSRARQLLYDTRPEVRAAAATYLGQVAGFAVLSALQDLIPDEPCAAAARLAMDRIEGKAPRLEPEPWP
jgi:hypothetical protein